MKKLKFLLWMLCPAVISFSLAYFLNGVNESTELLKWLIAFFMGLYFAGVLSWTYVSKRKKNVKWCHFVFFNSLSVLGMTYFITGSENIQMSIFALVVLVVPIAYAVSYILWNVKKIK